MTPLKDIFDAVETRCNDRVAAIESRFTKQLELLESRNAEVEANMTMLQGRYSALHDAHHDLQTSVSEAHHGLLKLALQVPDDLHPIRTELADLRLSVGAQDELLEQLKVASSKMALGVEQQNATQQETLRTVTSLQQGLGAVEAA